MPTSSCPTIDLLLALDRGDLPEPIALGTAHHLEQCAQCQTRLDDALGEIPGDPLRDGLRTLADAQARSNFTLLSHGTGITLSLSTMKGGVPSHTVNPLTEGHFFGKYQLLDQIGEGGTGIVYRALDLGLKRPVAIKMLKMGGAVSADVLARFKGEAEAIASFQHQNVVRIYELGEVAGQPFAVLEFIAGGSLAKRVKDTLVEPHVAARLLVAIATAIDAAHTLKIIHRDLKPANILLLGEKTTPLEECVPKVTDFGLAKFLDNQNSSTTHDNAVMGTPSYMAPEQASGKTADAGPPADIYALGATLYDLLSGRPPFKGTTVRETLQMVMNEEPAGLRRENRRIPRDLETICLKCLEKDPAQRYATAGEFAADLNRFLKHEPIRAHAVGPVKKMLRWTKRRPGIAVSMLIAACSLLGLFIATIWYAEARREREVAREEAAKIEAQRVAAEERAAKVEVEKQATEKLQLATAYYAHLTQARERLATRATQWTWDAIDDIREAAQIDTKVRNPVELRSVLAAALAGTSVRVRPDQMLAPEVNSWALAFHPNGRWVAIGEGRVGNLPSDLNVFLIDRPTGQTLQTFTYPFLSILPRRQDRMRTLAFSPDGKWLVGGTRAGQLHRWDLQEKTPQRQTIEVDRKADKVEYQEVEFSPDSGALYASIKINGGGSIIRWETKTWQLTSRYDIPDTSGGLVVRPDGKAVYCNDEGARIRQLDPVKLTRDGNSFGAGEARALAISPDGRILATSRQGRLVLWNTKTREPAGAFREPQREQAFPENVTVMRYSPDGRLLAAVNEFSRHVYLYDLVTGERLADWRSSGEGIHPIAFDRRGRWLAVGGEKGTTLLEISGQQEFRKLLPQRYPVVVAGISPDGQCLGTCVARQPNGQGAMDLALWNLNEQELPKLLWRKEEIGASTSASLQLTPEQRAIFVADGHVYVVEHRQRGEVIFDSPVDKAAFAVNAKQRLWVAAGNEVHALALGDSKLHPLKYMNTSALMTGRGEMVSLASGQKYLAAGGLDGIMRLFAAAVPPDTKKLTPLNTSEIDRRNDLRSIAFAPDESYAVVGTESGKVHVVSVPELNVLDSWSAHGDRVGHIVFVGPNLFVTGGKDRTVRFWTWKNNRVQELWSQRISGEVTSLSTTADGRFLTVTGLGERGVQVWDLAQLSRRFAEFGLGIQTPAAWQVEEKR